MNRLKIGLLIFIIGFNLLNASDTPIESDGVNCAFESITGVSKSECEALVKFYDEMDGDNWKNNSNWKSKKAVDDWYGVTVRGNKIIGLYLSSNSLNGNLSSVASLINLQQVYLSSNRITGDLLPLSSLTELKNLYLNSLNITGDLSALSTLINLQQLFASNNKITGNLSALSSLIELRNLHLYDTEIIGDISFLSSCTKLETLLLHRTSLVGDLSSLTLLVKLRTLWFHDTNISGDISSLTTLENLQSLILSNTNIRGDVSKLNHLSLSSLHIQNCKFDFSNLEKLFINNQFPKGFYFSPQKKIDKNRNLVFQDNHLTIIPLQQVNPSENDTYQWYKNDTIINGATDRIYTKFDATNKDNGIYTYRVKNVNVPKLTLHSKEINISVVLLDTDNDGIPDDEDLDDDNDGINDLEEIAHGLNPLDPSDAEADNDGDGYTNAEEIAQGSDIDDANSKPIANEKSILLAKGWTLLGINNNMTLDELKNKIGADNLLTIQSKSKTYQKRYEDNGESFLNDFKVLTQGDAIWIEVAQDITLTYTEDKYEAHQEIWMDAESWYLINPSKTMSLETIKNQLGDENIEVIQGQYTTYQKRYEDSGEGFLNDFDGFQEPRGYWILLINDGTLNF